MAHRLARFGAAVLAAVLLAGCGGGGGSGVVSPTPSPGPGADRSVASGYVYVNDDGRAARPEGAPRRLTVVREQLQQSGLRPLANASVSLANRVGAWLTNAEGYFEIPDVPEGEAEVTVVPPPDVGAAPGAFGIVAGPRPRPGGTPPGPPPVEPGDLIVVLPPHAALEVGEVAQFYAMTMGADGPEDITDDVVWRLRSRPGARPVGELSEGGLFTAAVPGEAMIVALAPGDNATRQDEVFALDIDIPAPGDIEARGSAFVRVLPDLTAIKGNVVSTNDQPVRGAFVFAKGIRDFSVTEYNGGFFIPLVPPDEPIELTVIYEGQVVATEEVTVPAGDIKEIKIIANVEVDPPPARPVHAIGRLLKPEATTWQYGTHVLRGDLMPLPMPADASTHGRDDGGSTGAGMIAPPPEALLFALQSDTVDLDEHLDTFVEVVGTRVEGYPKDGGPPLLDVREVRSLIFAAAEAGAQRPRPQGGLALGGHDR